MDDPVERNLPPCHVRTMNENEIPEFVDICRKSGIHSAISIPDGNDLSAYLVAVLETGEVVGTCCAHFVAEDRGLITGLAVRCGAVNWLEAQHKLLDEAKRRLSNVNLDINFPANFYTFHYNTPYTEHWYIHLYQVICSDIKLPEIEVDHRYRLTQIFQREEYPFQMIYYGDDNSKTFMEITGPSSLSVEVSFKLSLEEKITGYGEIIKYEDRWIVGPIYSYNHSAGGYLMKNMLLHMINNKMNGLVYTYVLNCNRSGITFLNKAGFVKPPIEWIRCSSYTCNENVTQNITYNEAKRIVYSAGTLLFNMY